MAKISAPVAPTNPTANDRVVEIGKMLGDPTRVSLLDALFDGRSYTVTELSKHVGVAQSTASEHLAKLLDAELVTNAPYGRSRYYRLRSPEVAELLERLFELGHTAPVKRSSRVPASMAYARSCYDHLAGTVAVGLTQHLIDTGMIHEHDHACTLTDRGADLFDGMGLQTTPGRTRRPTIRPCLDWSERKLHLAGAVPAQLLDLMLDRKWFLRRQTGRGLELTGTGRIELEETFGFTAP